MAILNIVPECFVDTKVAEILGQAKRYNHQHGCGDVANELKKKLQNNIALGIIDEDKNKGPAAKYLLEFKSIAEENSLFLKRHPQRNHYLIIICPEIESWLLNNANSVGLNPIDFGLEDNLKGFKQITKIKSIDNNIGFYRFIKELIKKETPGVITLKNWIEAFTKRELPFLP
jgi:hypothetical protein